jgi:predicted metalloprotease with PDZ domain
MGRFYYSRQHIRGAAALAAALAIACRPNPLVAQAPQAIRVSVDAREVSRGIWHAQMTFPARPGSMTLVYPKWIPGQHRPSGVIVNLVGLKFTAAGLAVKWRRDAEEMYAFHVDVPGEATELHATFDFLAPAKDSGHPLAESTTPRLAVLNWNQAVLYPQGPASDDVTIEAQLQLPPHWDFATALPASERNGDTISFDRVSLTRLVDSPVLTGAHLRKVAINEWLSPSHEIDMAGDSEAALAMTPELAAPYGRLVDEAGALFGARHYENYRWLVTLSDHTAHFGLEHHESSDNRVGERELLTDAGRRHLAGLLAHEYVHSWNGKFRRPAGLATPNYQDPMKGELLWVYEGLTEYLGIILAPRAGLWTPDEFRDTLAEMAAGMDHTAGRSWRPLADTTVGAPISYGSPRHWRAYRRSVDFYIEGPLIWLEVDTIIRRQTQGQRSLDDFCRTFFGGQGEPYQVKPYTFDDVVAALNSVSPFDWADFFRQRIDDVTPHAPLAGLEGSGWKLVYDDKPNTDISDREELRKGIDLTYSLGLQLNEEGVIDDVVPGLPGEKAGLAPGLTLVAVNGRKWSAKLLREAVGASRSVTEQLELLVENEEFFKTHSLDYHNGARYPHLERDGSRADVLSDIIKPRLTDR